jgi:RNA polymerase sigma factor for flagellar operon FliA
MAKAANEPGTSALWRRFTQNGDPAARERLVLAYSPLVKYVTGRLARTLPAHVDEADLISYGLLGLISAIDRFDPSRNIKFETYAAIRIKGSIVDELRALDWVPRSVRADAGSIEGASARLTHRLQRTPRDREIADELGVPIKKLHESRRHISRSPVVALDTPCPAKDGSGNSMSIAETIHDPLALDPAQALDAAEMRARLADAIAGLPEKEKVVVTLYFYEDLTLREIGEVLRVTESRVSQIRTRAILRLKARLQASEHVRLSDRPGVVTGVSTASATSSPSPSARLPRSSKAQALRGAESCTPTWPPTRRGVGSQNRRPDPGRDASGHIHRAQRSPLSDRDASRDGRRLP